MAGNSFGQLFQVTTFGESHGPAIGGIVDGCPPGMKLSEADIQPALDKRRPGQSRFVSQRKELDYIQILSGIFEGKTTGTPIGLLIKNCDAQSKAYQTLKNLFRPGHADYTYAKKYGIRDYRGGGRASARETAVRVAAGAIAQKYLRDYLNIDIVAYLCQMGEITLDLVEVASIDNNPFFCADPSKVNQLADYLEQIRKAGDSIGAGVKIIAKGVPAGLGDPVFDKLNATIAHAMMSINAVKAVEIGAGFNSISQRGSEHRDAITPQGFSSNHAGGILGGLSTGQEISIRIALKPPSSIPQAVSSVNTQGEATQVVTTGRHDPCVGIRAVPIASAMLAIVLMDHFLRFRGQCGDRI